MLLVKISKYLKLMKKVENQLYFQNIIFIMAMLKVFCFSSFCFNAIQQFHSLLSAVETVDHSTTSKT